MYHQMKTDNQHNKTHLNETEGLQQHSNERINVKKKTEIFVWTIGGNNPFICLKLLKSTRLKS